MPARRYEPVQLTGLWDGWVIDYEGVLWAPDTWRNGFTPDQLRAMFFECQQIRSLKSDLRRSALDIEALTSALQEQQRLTAIYRSQCHYEAGFFVALSIPRRG